MPHGTSEGIANTGHSICWVYRRLFLLLEHLKPWSRPRWRHRASAVLHNQGLRPSTCFSLHLRSPTMCRAPLDHPEYHRLRKFRHRLAHQPLRQQQRWLSAHRRIEKGGWRCLSCYGRWYRSARYRALRPCWSSSGTLAVGTMAKRASPWQVLWRGVRIVHLWIQWAGCKARRKKRSEGIEVSQVSIWSRASSPKGPRLMDKLWSDISNQPHQSFSLFRLRRDSVGADFQSVRKLTNYICAKPPEITSEAVFQRLLGAPTISTIFPIFVVELLNHNSLKYYQRLVD